MLAGVLSCTAINGIYFHFWSRTIKQESGGSTNKQFQANQKYYLAKWGGNFLKERYQEPFGGIPYRISGVEIPNTVLISDRDYERKVIPHWRG